MLETNDKNFNNYLLKLSIVLPTFNEAQNLEILIPQIEKEFKNELLEIIVVDDNSQDGTKKLIAALNNRFRNIKLISRPKLMGIGSAIRDGYNAARGEYILSSDADLSFKVDDMRRLYSKLGEGFDFVVAYRHGEGGGYERKTLAVKIKFILSWFGNFVVRNLSGLDVKDVSANFRIIRRDAWQRLRTVENTNSLLFEMIVKAKENGLKIAEIPIIFSERRFGESKLNMVKEGPKFLVKFIKYIFLDKLPKKHWLVFALALVLGALMVLPFFYFRVKLGSDFHGVLPAAVNDVMFYYARVNDAANGHSFLNNAYLFEHKSGLPQQLFLAEWLLAQPIKIFNLDINTARFIYNFLLPAIAFILTYLALFLVSKSRFWSIIFSTFLFFGLYLLAFIRPVSPQFNFIFWLTQFVFLWLLIQRSDSKNAQGSDPCILALNILNFGLMFYIYHYYWTFYLIFLMIFATLNFANSKYFHNSNYGSKQIIQVVVGGLVLAIPYFYFNYLAAQLPYYTETLTRLGMIYSRFPSGARIIFWSSLGLAAFGWFLRWKIVNWNIKTMFFISGILASVIAVNQHIITGRNIEFSSHYDMAAMFFLVFAMAYLISQHNANLRIYANSTNKTQYLKPILGIIILIFISQGILNYSKRVFAIDENAVYRQNYAPIFEWLNKNTHKDSVVYANVDLSGLIPVYTANNVFYIREANLFFISDEEVLDRFILNNFFSALGGSTVGGEKFDRNFVVENVRSIYGVRYIDAYGHAVQENKLRRILRMKLKPEIYLSEEAIQKVITRAEELQKRDFIEELKRFRVDYLVWDKNKNPNWKINPENFNSVFQNGGLIIFKLVF